MKYINVFDIVSRLRQMEKSGLIDEFEDVLFEIITAPGISIVYCKDCKFQHGDGTCERYMTKAGIEHHTTMHGFCAWGREKVETNSCGLTGN